MDETATRIALYGKGGIGKSTIAANLSAAMALGGRRVLQAGCDPKQDSTRLLLGGVKSRTVLEYLKNTQPAGRRLDDVVTTGYGGIACVEAGGPEPGVGCAGRGILSAFDLLAQLNVEARGFDVYLYDVLGDVVCGGFAVPLRQEYADLVYIVTSGEFMSLYAANNILRGVRNFESHGPRVGGLILNRRGIEDEEGRVRRFAAAVDLSVVGDFPRSELFAEAERAVQPVVAAFPGSSLAQSFLDLARKMLCEPCRHAAKPLSPDELEEVVLQVSAATAPAVRPFVTNEAPPALGAEKVRPELPVRSRQYCSKGVREHTTLFGCAFNGAVHTASQLEDAVIVVHGPRSCTYLSSIGTVSSLRRSWRRSGRTPAQWPAEMLWSDMDERVLIFGGNDGLEAALRRAASRAPSVIFVITTCSSGIIGDDVEIALKCATEELAGIRTVVLQADGDMTGDYSQGVLDAAMQIASSLIDSSCEAEGESVNIIGEKNLVQQTDVNYHIVAGLLADLGIEVNCRFIRQSNTQQISRFGRARLNLLAYDDLFGRTLRDYLRDRHKASFAQQPFPIGFRQTESWLMEIAEFFGRRERARSIVERYREDYKGHARRLRTTLAGRRVFVVTQNRHIDWVFDTALDLGMEIVRVGILDSAWDDEIRTRYGGCFPIIAPYARERRFDDLRDLCPDLTLTDFRWGPSANGAHIAPIPYGVETGFFSGLSVAGQWRDVLRTPAVEGWRDDL